MNEEKTEYEKLKGKASKGKFEADENRDIRGANECIADCYYRFDCEQEIANAQLIAHTLNHFDTLLEALREFADLIESFGVGDYLALNDNQNLVMMFQRVDKALKEAQEVEA